MSSPVSPARTAGLVVASVVLVALAYVAVAMGFFGGAAWATVLGWALVAAGLVCAVAALRQSLGRWQMTGRLPVVAVLYAALGVAALGWWASGPARESAVYRDTPGATSAEIAGDGVDVRDARGLWHVSFAGCAGARAAAARGVAGTRSHDGVVEVLGAGDRPAMRLHVAERRTECL